MITVTGWRHRRFAQGNGQGFERWVWGVEVTLEHGPAAARAAVLLRLIPDAEGELRCPAAREGCTQPGAWVTTPDDAPLDPVMLAVMETLARVHLQSHLTPYPGHPTLRQ